jgi:restriction endonuclease Mrr
MPDIFIQFVAVAFGALAVGFLLIFFVKRSASLERPRSKPREAAGEPAAAVAEYGFEEFRRLVVDLLEALGLQVTHEAQAGSEIDFVARTSGPLTGGKYIVHVRVSPPYGIIESPDVLKLVDTVKADEAQKGILITTHGFSAEAVTAAQSGAVELIDGQQFRTLFEKYVGPLKPSLREVP